MCIFCGTYFVKCLRQILCVLSVRVLLHHVLFVHLWRLSFKSEWKRWMTKLTASILWWAHLSSSHKPFCLYPVRLWTVCWFVAIYPPPPRVTLCLFNTGTYVFSIHFDPPGFDTIDSVEHYHEERCLCSALQSRGAVGGTLWSRCAFPVLAAGCRYGRESSLQQTDRQLARWKEGNWVRGKNAEGQMRRLYDKYLCQCT